MQTMLLTIGAQATAMKRRRVLSSAAAEREEAVGGDLDHEPAQEPGGHLALEQDAVDLVGAGMRIEHGEGVNEEGRGDQCRQRGGQQDHHRHREDGGNGVEGLPLALVGQPIDEDGDEGGGEHAAEDDVVEHVGRGVGQVVGVGQRGLPEGPGQSHEAEQPGDPGHAGPDRDIGGRRAEGQRPGAPGGDHGQLRPRAGAPGPSPGAHPPDQQDGAGEGGEGDADEGDLGRVHREHGVGDEDLAVRRVQGHFDRQAVARGAGLGGHPDRGGGVDERQALRVAVGEGELVAAERDDDGDRIGSRGQHRDGDGGLLRRERDGALGSQRDLTGRALEGLRVRVQRAAASRRAEAARLGGQEGVAQRGQVGGVPRDGRGERGQLLAVERDAARRAARDAAVGGARPAVGARRAHGCRRRAPGRRTAPASPGSVPGCPTIRPGARP